MKRKIYKLLSGAKQILFALALTVFSVTGQSQTFNYTGNVQTVTLPAGNYSIQCWGADGGTVAANTALPGKGGYTSADITLSVPTTFSIYVGGKGNGGVQPLGGFNSGNSTTKTNIATATGGGGATDIRVLVDDFFHRIIVAGGGGGQGTSTGTGGHGGGLTGQNGQGTGNAGVGGSQTAPGLYPAGGDAKPAVFGEGGDGPVGTTGGQGGGGWYGGSFGTRTNGGGAGGSGYVLTANSFTPIGYFSANPSYYCTNTLTAMSGATGFISNPDITGNGRVVITPLCSITMTASGTDGLGAICPGNSVTLTTNGTANYNWSTGNTTSSVVVVTPLSTTIYSVSATSPMACTASVFLTVIVNPAPNVSASSTPTLVCAGASATLDAIGDAASYTWVGGPTTNSYNVNPPVSTVYTVTGSSASNTCVTTMTVQLGVFDAAFSVSGPSVVCAGRSVTLAASGASTYVWVNQGTNSSITVTPAVQTIYTVTASTPSNNINCSSTRTILVNVNPNPTVNITASNTVICQDSEQAILTATGASTYSWSNQGNTSAITVTAGASGTFSYLATGTDVNGCTASASVQVMVNACTAIGERADYEKALLVYPNPGRGEFFVRSAADPELSLFNELGQEVKHIQTGDYHDHEVSVKDLPSGIYFIVGRIENTTINKKLIMVD